jgi:uncharacterized membrane protein
MPWIPERRTRQLFGMERLNALSDGLFAIVLTLLVLELKLPEQPNSVGILDDLVDNYHDFIAWIISFIALSRFWMVHHTILARIGHCELGTIARNFVLLAAISLMPFTASLIGTYRITEPWSTAIFAANLAAASIALGLLAKYLTRHPDLLAADADRAVVDWHRRHHTLVLPAVAMVVMGLAFVEPYLATLLIIVEFSLFMVAVLR